MMKALTLLVLCLLAVQVYTQTQPVIYKPFNRTIATTQSGTFLLSQRLPACYQANYLVSDITTINEGDLFSVLYVPRTNASIPAPSSTVTIQFYKGNTAAPQTPITISSVINQPVNQIPYLSQAGGCPIDLDQVTVNRAPGSADSGCGINYYCSGFTSTQSTRLWVVITTTDAENAAGILFDLAVQKSNIPIGNLTFSQTTTTTTNPPVGSAYFKPTVAQKHYKIKIGAAGTSLTQQADYLTLANPNNKLVFTLSNVKVGNVVQSLGTNLGEWSLTINLNDIAHANDPGLLVTDPSQPCLFDNVVDPSFYLTSTNLTLEYTGCGLLAGTYYIAIGLPLNFNTSYTYDLLVSLQPQDKHHYTPTYQTLTQGVYINDNVGYFTTNDAELYNIYLLNISPANFTAGASSIFVTIFGVDNGDLLVELTQNCFGFDDNCGGCATIAECGFDFYHDTDFPNARDYCKIKVEPCTANANLPYFVTVRADNVDKEYTYISYSIKFDIVTVNVVDITTLRQIQGNGYIDYVYSGLVAERDYNHFVYKVDASKITPVTHLSARLYVDQQVQEANFAHNVDKLAGSAPYTFFTYGSDSYSGYTDVYNGDDCYTWDWHCNSFYKNQDSPILNFPHEYYYIGACSLVLPYCQLVAANTGHYFSVYGVNAGPNSYWSTDPLYDNGIGYNRSIEYTAIFRLWSFAEQLSSIEIQNGFVYGNTEFPYTYYNSDTNYLNYNPYGTNFADNAYSHQYVYSIPADNNLYDSIRVVLGDVQIYSVTQVQVHLYASCGQAAGDCPCFAAADFSCTAGVSSGSYDEFSCEIYIPLCQCNSGKIYFSVRSEFLNFAYTPISFNIGVYPQITTKVGTIGVPTSAAQIEDLLTPSLDFNPFTYSTLPGTPQSNSLGKLGELVFFDSALYSLKLNNLAAQRALEFTVRFTRAPSKVSYTQLILLSIGENLIPPSNPLAADCSVTCVATTRGGGLPSDEGWGYCTIVLQPCEINVGSTYYIRLSGAASTPLTDFYDSSAGVGYTLTVANVNNAATPLTIGAPYADSVHQDEYNHYSVAVPTTPGSLRVKVFRNFDQADPLVVYLNTNGSLAGNIPCYAYDQICYLDGHFDLSSSACEFFIPACDLAALSGQTVYLSVQSNYYYYFDDVYLYGPYFQQDFFVNSGLVEGDNEIDYTVDIEFDPIRVLSLTPGSTVTGNLYDFQSAYYSYTIAAADITAGKILHIELQSIEPISSYASVAQLRTTFSATSPAAQSNGCPCSDEYRINDFKIALDACYLNGKAGTYYFSVKALVNGFDADRDPISYTVKAYWTVPITASLALSTTYTASPKALNFNDRVLYSIPVTSSKNNVIEIEIADLNSQIDSLYANGLTAYLNFGNPASEFCNIDSCHIYNSQTSPVTNGTVMCRFTITPCTQCTGTYYVLVVGEFAAPEPRVQYRATYNIRAYNHAIGTLDGFTTSSTTFRSNATATNGVTFTIANTANPQVTCDDRWGKTIFFDYFYQLPSLSVNLYETLDVTSSASNSASFDVAFGSNISPARFECGCDAGPGGDCNFIDGCQTAATTAVTIYGRVGIASCTGSNTNATVNGIAFNTQIKADRVYTALSAVKVNPNTTVTQTLKQGQYVVLQFQPTSVNFNLLPTITYNIDLSNSGGSVNDRTCYSDGIGSAVAPTTFPGSAALGSSYCDECIPMPTTPFSFDGCCYDPNDNTYITVYNPFNSGVASFNFTFQVTITNAVAAYTALSLPISQTFTSVRSDTTTEFSFNLSPANLNPDDVLYVRITSTNGTAIAYFNSLYYARSAGTCTGSDFTCTTGNNCIFQLPACYFSTVTPGGYVTYYVSLEASSALIVGPVTLSITAQRTTTLSFPTSSPLSGSVPDQASTPVDYVNHYKFVYSRTVGDQGLNDNRVALKVVLTPTTNANNTLLLSISNAPLAGPPLSPSNPASGGVCDYSNDNAWQCFATNNTNGPQTRNTQGNLGVTCFLYFCNNGVPEADLAGQIFYVSVQNQDNSNGRVVTSYTLAASLQSLTLPSNEVQYSVTPSHANTDANITSTACSSTAITGGCQFRASNFSTAYFQVNLQNIAQWGYNDYLLFNFTQVSNTINIDLFSNDQCEPASGETFLTCNPGQSCTIQFDPCDFTAYFRADNGANSYVVEARNLYVRVAGIVATTTFNFVAQQVTPLQITVPLTAAAPSYSQTFQSWEGRWTMFNFVLPKTHLYALELTITSNCGATQAPQVFLNEYVSQWASRDCTEIDGKTLPFEWTHYSCDPDGNFYVSVYTPIGSLEFDPIAIPEGLVSPQIKFTITANLVNVASYVDYAWESDVTIHPNSIVNFQGLGDNENYGTVLTIELSSINIHDDISLTIVTPLWRSTYVETTDGYAITPIGSFYTGFYFGEDGECAFPTCDEPGVYCCDKSSDCTINIPPCDYRNGRHYIYASTTGSAAILSSRVYRQDYISVALSASNNFYATSEGTLPLGIIHGDNVNVNYYQFYQITLTSDASFLHLALYTTYTDLLFDIPNFTGNQNGVYPLLRGSLKRGDTGISTSSDNGDSSCDTGSCAPCTTIYCSTEVPGICDFGDVVCTSSTYFLGVWFQHHSDSVFSDCDLLTYHLIVDAQEDAPLTLEPNSSVCGTLQGTLYDFTNPPQVADPFYLPSPQSTTRFLHSQYLSKRDSFDLYNEGILSSDDEEDGVYPYTINYKVDLTGINTSTAEFIFDLLVFATDIDQDVQLSLATDRTASSICNDCFDITNVNNNDFTASVSISCGAFSSLWVSVTASNANLLIFDYTLSVTVNQYTTVAATIPTLSFGIPSTVSVSLKGDSVVTVGTNSHAVALIRPSDAYKVSSGNDYNGNCGDGCPVAEPGCIYLASAASYSLFYQVSLPAASNCFTTVATSASYSFEVQSVHVVNIPASGFTNVSATVQFGGVELIYASLPAFGITTDSITIFTASALQSGVSVRGSCTGFTDGANCVNKVLFSFDDQTRSATLDVEKDLCGCSALYITVSQDANACGSRTDFSLSFQSSAGSLPTPAVALTSAVYIADTLPTFGGAGIYNTYTVVAGADGLIHSSINMANNTAGPNFHSLNAYLYNAQYCIIDQCTTGVYAKQNTPAREDNDQDRSCFLYTNSAVSGATYYIQVDANEAIEDPTATYRINAITSYTDLESTASSHFQLIGFDRHYYKVNGRAGGVASGALQSVVVSLNLIDGDRVVVLIADSPNYINAFVNGVGYSGWARNKVCYYGECTLEIPTRAQHPGAPVFYVWVATISTDFAEDERIEKFTNYQISATTGTNNCLASSSVTGFCASTVSTLTNVYNYRNVSLRTAEAQARFDSFLCRCNPPSSTCVASLTRFSCLESFRECDVGGFWTPICRSECQQTVTSCGTFEESDGSCSCTRSEFTCSNPRYSDAASAGCTGATLPTPSASPVPVSPSNLPSGASKSNSPVPSGASLSRTPSNNGGKSHSHSPSHSPSHAGGHHTPSRTPTPHHGHYTNTLIYKYYIYVNSDASSLFANTFFAVLASTLLTIFFF